MSRALLKLLRLVRDLAWWSAAGAFICVVASWAISFHHPHGVARTGHRVETVWLDRGVIQLSRTIRTDVVQHGRNAWSIEEVGFDTPGATPKWEWRPRPMRMVFS